MRRQSLLICCAFLCIAGVTWAAPTGYVKDFTGDIGQWPANPSYTISQANGIATMLVDKRQTWAGQRFLLGARMISRISLISPCKSKPARR